MAEIFSIHEAKTHLSRLIAAALAGKEVIIRRGKEPVVKLTPIEPTKGRVPGAWKGRISMSEDAFAPMDESELALWEGRDETL